MSAPGLPRHCPDCDDPIFFTFWDTGGTSAPRRGEAFNSTPDTAHYVCFPCEKTWKQRLTGPLTPDVLGDLAFFSCGVPQCGSRMTVSRESAIPTEIELTCAQGHRFAVRATEEGGLTAAKKGSG